MILFVPPPIISLLSFFDLNLVICSRTGSAITLTDVTYLTSEVYCCSLTSTSQLNSIEYSNPATIYDDIYDIKKVVKKFYRQFEDLRTDLV